jgi:hypothetical protein
MGVILAIFMSAAAFLLTFFAVEKSQSQRSEKTKSSPNL